VISSQSLEVTFSIQFFDSQENSIIISIPNYEFKDQTLMGEKLFSMIIEKWLQTYKFTNVK
jgi:hypothetical protein